MPEIKNIAGDIKYKKGFLKKENGRDVISFGIDNSKSYSIDLEYMLVATVLNGFIEKKSAGRSVAKGLATAGSGAAAGWFAGNKDWEKAGAASAGMLGSQFINDKQKTPIVEMLLADGRRFKAEIDKDDLIKNTDILKFVEDKDTVEDILENEIYNSKLINDYERTSNEYYEKLASMDNAIDKLHSISESGSTFEEREKSKETIKKLEKDKKTIKYIYNLLNNQEKIRKELNDSKEYNNKKIMELKSKGMIATQKLHNIILFLVGLLLIIMSIYEIYILIFKSNGSFIVGLIFFIIGSVMVIPYINNFNKFNADIGEINRKIDVIDSRLDNPRIEDVNSLLKWVNE